jgi:hypothetical protein
MVDVNGDSLDDCIIDWNKTSLQDGDTLFVSVYLQHQDSTFHHFKTFDNLYPVYFKWYYFDYIPQDTTLIPLVRKYEGYPFRKLKFEQNSIIITIKLDAKTDLKTVYVYDKILNNWLYQNSTEILYEGDERPRDLKDKLGPTIDDFTYFWWDK